MYGVNNSVKVPNAYNYGKNAQAQSPQEQQKTTSPKKAMRADEILFTEVYNADKSSVDALGLSDNAKNLLLELKEKYKGYDFMVGDYETDEQASRILNGGKGTIMNVLITPDLLEEMAADESVRAKYENIIAGASDQFTAVKSKLNEGGKYYLGNLGLTVNEDGTCNYYAFLKNGLTNEDGKNFLKASSAQELADMLNALAEKRAEQTEKTEEAQKEYGLKEESILSDKARQLLSELREKYKGYDFMLADWSTDEEASTLLSAGMGEKGNVLITADLLEKMAADESERAKYEGILDQAAGQMDTVKSQLTEDGRSIVEKLGMTVNSDGSVSFFAKLIDGVTTDDGGSYIKCSIIEDFTKSLNTLAEARKKMLENKEESNPVKLDTPEEKEEKVEKSVMPPKSFEKYEKEENPYSTEEDYGNLPPESFKKYQDVENAAEKEAVGEAMNFTV